MTKRTLLLASLAVLLAAAGLQAATCTPTGFFRDNINMTAAMINPTAPVTGEVDATGCNIGVYFDQGTGVVNQANIHGANYFGVAVNGDYNPVAVDVLSSTISDIGENPLNGSQHGVGIYYRAMGVGTASGKISGNTVQRYQKGGIVANGPGITVTVSANTVLGEGRVAYIAQNGIQIGYGAAAQVQKNVVVGGHAYTGPGGASSGGILVVGGSYYGGALTVGTQIVGNTLVNNDIGVYLSNMETGGAAPVTPTNIKVVNNTITNDALTNTSGGGVGVGYQAGISDVGNGDKFIANTISGAGYAETDTATMYAKPIDADASFTNKPKAHANK